MNRSELTVMLTHNDFTVKNASDIFESCKYSQAKFWGFKEQGIPKDEMKQLYAYMKSYGKTTFLEVVEYDEEKGLQGAQSAAECGCDILMGTTYFDSIHNFCKLNNLKYMPFVGKISGRPSLLEGDIDDMVQEANDYLNKGVYGIDLLGYRYIGDADELITTFVKKVNGPVCVAGSIDNYDKLDLIKNASPWSFTIGSAFFDNRFDGSFFEQINKVHEYMDKEKII